MTLENIKFYECVAFFIKVLEIQTILGKKYTQAVFKVFICKVFKLLLWVRTT